MSRKSEGLKMVRIIKFRIKNYKSIIDSGDCYLSNGITVLAGKNESGKSSILEALEDFDTEKQIDQDAVRIQDENLKPEITLTFGVDPHTLSKIYKKIFVEKNNKEIEIVICKNIENLYSLINSNELFAKHVEHNKILINSFRNKLQILTNSFGKHGIFVKIGSVTNKNYLQIIDQISNIELNSYDLSKENKDNISRQMALLNHTLDGFVDIQIFETEFIEKFKRYIPHFILFDTYKDQIPNEIPLRQLNNNEFINDLATISDLKTELIQTPSNVRANMKHKDEINISISEEYKQFWEQDTANLYLDWNNEYLYFWIKEKNEYYKPEQRSKGRQWHLAFYVKITARSKDDTPNILLIDEPGLFLHAKAQKDILKKLEESSKHMNVIYSTHSPYLIDADKLNRVRLVERSETEGTKISKIHAKADKETLTPILTAIGEDLSQGIKLDKNNSFIVEGISDYYYLHAFKKLIGSDIELNIVPGCGDNIPAIASILFGWGLNPYFILDSDKPKLRNKLHKKLAIPVGSIITVLDERGTIENIFSEDDFKKFVLDNEDADLSKSFIQHIKENGGKELVAKQFLEKIENGDIKKEDLSKSTNQNIEIVFEKISELLQEIDNSN